MDDKAIIAGLTARREDTLTILAQRFGRPLQHLATNILGNSHDAQECVNDTYFALWNSIPPAKPDPLAGYVMRTGRNLALKKLRENTARKRDSRYDLSLDELAEALSGGTLEEIVEARELGRAIDRFLDTLNKENRILFLRRYWFGDSVQTIAKMRGMTENSVSVRLNRIRSKLRNYLTEEEFL
jgi:RNA polymerase sigma-70 factor (ECF subfamily)